MISVLGDPGTCFFDNGFSDGDEKKPLQSDQKRKKFPNPFSCIVLSFIKRPIKEGAYNRDDRSHIYCYTPQLCDRTKSVNTTSRNKPFVLFRQVDEEYFGEGFDLTELVGSDPDKKLRTRKAVKAIAQMMHKQNEARIVQNLENVAKKLPSDRVFTVYGNIFNDFSNSRIILE